VIFTIGLGESIWNYYPDPTQNPPDDLDVGSRLLRFIASVGTDGDPNNSETASDPCYSVSSGSMIDPTTDCGNYFFTNDGANLGAIFDEIARRVFTRLTG
jgi:hypothetical protein